MSAATSGKAWQKTSFANLIRYVPSGTYFARLRVQGKLIRKTLRTDVLSVAKLRLGDLEKAERQTAETQAQLGRGKVKFGEALDILKERITGNANLKPRSKDYYGERINALNRSWPALASMDLRDITKTDCLKWAGQFGQNASACAYNNTLKILKDALDIGVELGARYDNPAKSIERITPKLKKLKLPTQEQFKRWLEEMDKLRSPWSERAVDTVRFLAFTGCRKNEAANVTWADVDFDLGKITVRVTKNGQERTIPIITDARSLLEQMRAERNDEPLTAGVLPLHECQVTMDRAAKAVGMERITHHDLRHLFATRCIEAGVDIPTVSRWLGHLDGGALAMKVYGHLRDQHSQAMAQKVKF